jgi:hypothetical protein
MTRFLISIALVCAGLASHATARDYFILLGGGAGPASSEVSIEKNVEWISGLLDSRGHEDHDVLFAAGLQSPIRDVKTNRLDPDLAELWFPIARVFGNRSRLFEAFHKNAVARSPGVASRDNALGLVQERLAAMQAGDNLMLIYNGHGGRSDEDASRHHLRLWNNTRLTVGDLVQTLEHQPPQTAFRFVLPQCYSGPFLMTIHRQLSIGGSGPVSTARCGFTAAPHHRESEGCTEVEDEREYVDYSTYFFAALDGQSRLGHELAQDPDINGDGLVGLNEAHFYAATHSYSRDVPGATSEYFLQRWQPWYVRGQTWSYPESSGDGHYAQMARSVAVRLGFPADLDHVILVRKVSGRRTELESGIDGLKDEIKSLEQREQDLRGELARSGTVQWPELRNPYGVSFNSLEPEDIGGISAWLQIQPLYAELESVQNEIDTGNQTILEMERDLGMHLRILRWLELSRLEYFLYRFGSGADISSYESLQDCESWTGLSE